VDVVAPPVPSMVTATPLKARSSLKQQILAPAPLNLALAWDIMEGRENWRLFTIYYSTNPAGPFSYYDQLYIEYPTNITIQYPFPNTNSQGFFHVEAYDVINHQTTPVTTKK